MNQQIYDISDLLFMGDESLTPEQIRETELWDRATQEAIRIVGYESPMKILSKTEELYSKYIGEEK